MNVDTDGVHEILLNMKLAYDLSDSDLTVVFSVGKHLKNQYARIKRKYNSPSYIDIWWSPTRLDLSVDERAFEVNFNEVDLEVFSFEDVRPSPGNIPGDRIINFYPKSLDEFAKILLKLDIYV